MGDLTFFLILSGIVVIVLVAAFSYYLHHKKIRDEVQGFGHHANQIDDVLLQQHEIKTHISDEELPNSFNAKSDDNIDLELSVKSKATKEKQKQSINLDKPADNTSEALTENKDNTFQSSDKKPSLIQGQVIKMAKEPVPKGIDDLIIAMAIKRSEGNLSGKEILTACQACNIQFGEMDIFHYPADNNPTTYALFSIANMLEPGTFDLNKMDDFSTTGLSLFMQLPLPMNCLDAYDIFIDKARLLAKFLNAELYDEKFNLVTNQVISHNKEKINILHHKILKARKMETS